MTPDLELVTSARHSPDPLNYMSLKINLAVIDLVQERLDLAIKYGADVVINPLRDDALAIIRSLTDGYGCNVYIETTGAPAGNIGGVSDMQQRCWSEEMLNQSMDANHCRCNRLSGPYDRTKCRSGVGRSLARCHRRRLDR